MKQNNRSIFALRLRMLRRNAHMTQADIAERLNIHRTTYTKYETDQARPDQKCLVQLSDLFRVSVDYILGKTEEPALPESALNNAVGDPREMAMLAMFRHLSDEQKDTLLEAAANMETESIPFELKSGK